MSNAITQQTTTLRCFGRDQLVRDFYLELEKDSDEEHSYFVSRQKGIQRHPEYSGNDHFYARFVKEDAQTIRLSEIFANKDFYRGKGIPEGLFAFVSHTTNLTIRSSTTSSDSGAERRSDDATRMWERMLTKGLAEYCPVEDRYTYQPNELPIYVLDTSALKSLSFKELCQLSRTAHVCVSPISLFELLCHFDQPRKDGEDEETTFTRRRGELLKASQLMILPSPLADVHVRAGHPESINPTWHGEAQVCWSFLQALEKSGTLESFNQSQVTDEEGNLRSVDEVAARARDTLDSAETDYVQKVLTWQESLEKSNPDWRLGGSEDFVRQVAKSAAAMVPAECATARETVAFRFAPYFGYMFSRAKKGNPEKNDMEDGLLCLHLDPSQRWQLVTNDKGTLAALAETLQAFDETDPSTPLLCKAIAVEELKTSLSANDT